MGDILKEAIADAKAVRETALENAKMALEEAFTPQIKSMLSAKLKEEEIDDEFPAEEVPAEEDEEVTDEVPAEEVPAEEIPAEETYEDEEVTDEVPAEEVPIAAEDEEIPAEDGEEEGNLDLEAIIRELESELSEGEDEDDEGEEVSEGEEAEEEEPVEEEYDITIEGDEEDEEETVDESEATDKSSGIGKSDNHNGESDKSSGVGTGSSSTDVEALGEVKAELAEYKEAVSFLKDKLHEVNILNAKLLFTNKLFKSFSLDNNQKLKVVETFDRAQTTREIKLVYSTLCEQFVDNGSITRKNITESIASAKSGSTKPSKESRKVISEETQVANRFRKLAGLNK